MRLNIVDYLFRTLALAFVWCALAFPATASNLYPPANWKEWLFTYVLLVSGILLTIVIWCGPEIVRRRSVRATRSAENGKAAKV